MEKSKTWEYFHSEKIGSIKQSRISSAIANEYPSYRQRTSLRSLLQSAYYSRLV
jgi:hypothetical protein